LFLKRAKRHGITMLAEDGKWRMGKREKRDFPRRLWRMDTGGPQNQLFATHRLLPFAAGGIGPSVWGRISPEGQNLGTS
jgi:hypothetical protein